MNLFWVSYTWLFHIKMKSHIYLHLSSIKHKFFLLQYIKSLNFQRINFRILFYSDFFFFVNFSTIWKSPIQKSTLFFKLQSFINDEYGWKSVNIKIHFPRLVNLKFPRIVIFKLNIQQFLKTNQMWISL